MGSTSWSDDFHRDREATRAREGTEAFHHDAAVRSGQTAKQVHAQMNPHGVENRESRDSEDHPESNAIGVMFDVTGSMRSIPITLQKKLAKLMGLLLRKSYIPHPQVLMGAIGDTRSDDGPLQVGQYESGIEMDDDLGKFWLEGGGGGSMEESYELALYFFARHTSIDCHEKRSKKGYLFIIGDEKPYDLVRQLDVKRVIGDDIEADIPIEDIIAECQAKYNVFFILPKGTAYWNSPEIHDKWASLLSEENFLRLEDPDAVCETIATAIGLCEGTVDLDQAKAHLKDEGVDEAVVGHVTTTLTSLSRKGTEPSEGNVRL